MSYSTSFPHLDRVTLPLEEISRVWAYSRQVDRNYIRTFVGDIKSIAIRQSDWNFLGAAVTFWDPVHVVFNIQGTELTPTIEEYHTLLGKTAATRGIVEPNFHTTRPVLVSHLLGVHKSQLQAELAYSGGTEIVTAKLLRFIEIRVREVQGDLFQKNLCHAILLLIFETLLFPRSASHIDAALASVVLQVVGGRRYEGALLAKTMRSLDRVTRKTDRRLRGSLILLQIWLQSHANPFCLEERDFQATEEYVLRFHRWGPSTPKDPTDSTPDKDGSSSVMPRGSDNAVLAELTSLRVERDHLRREVAEKEERLIDQRQLQRELAQARAEALRYDQELARANTTLERSRKRNTTSLFRGTLDVFPAADFNGCALPHSGFQPPSPAYALPPSTTPAMPPTHDAARIAALKGTVNQLAANMAANMAKFVALLRGPNRASSSSISPPRQRPTVDPIQWILPALALKNRDAPFFRRIEMRSVGNARTDNPLGYYLFTAVRSFGNRTSSCGGTFNVRTGSVHASTGLHANHGSNLHCSSADGVFDANHPYSHSHR
ncbi:hypothetical protein CRG98_007318 [Punica granatum]|uniref:DUF7745 domain-containing protein n=1 Tax=Punica granatum TaxID=22663 RepID=A0A2I0KUV2_PUNGR|nr:hypothetical protein CRG98_007318 [Punica granatum]